MIGKSILRTYIRVWLELIYHSLENPRSNWVVVIGLELLSLACLGLGLGSEYVHRFIPVSPCHGYGYLDPTSVENMIWGDGIGTCRCDANSSRLLSSAMLEACG
jgi:hypothetical protein